MLASMPPEVYLKWQRYQAEEPWPWEQVRMMLAKLCALIANSAEDSEGKKFLYRNGKEPMSPSDFIPTPWITISEPFEEYARQGAVRGMSAEDADAFLRELMGKDD